MTASVRARVRACVYVCVLKVINLDTFDIRNGIYFLIYFINFAQPFKTKKSKGITWRVEAFLSAHTLTGSAEEVCDFEGEISPHSAWGLCM